MLSLFGPGDEGGCDAYRGCRDHPTKSETREFLERTWQRLGHLVGDRERDFRKQFRSDFHARSWELYLLSLLSEAGCGIEPGKPAGPDICASIGGRRVWIEAVVPTPGASTSSDRLFQRPPGNYAGSLYPESQLLLRYCSALEEKLRKIDGYVANGLVAATDVVLIALGQGGILDSDLHDVEVPAIVKAVYPIGEPVMLITPNSNQPARVELPARFSVEKKSGAKVPTTMFVEARSAAVSGVLFASQAIWNLRRSPAEALGLVHNLMASSPCPRRPWPLRCELWVERGELQHAGKCSRLG